MRKEKIKKSFFVLYYFTLTQHIVSSLYIEIPYLVKWFFVNFIKSGILRHKSEYFFCASDFRIFLLAFFLIFMWYENPRPEILLEKLSSPCYNYFLLYTLKYARLPCLCTNLVVKNKIDDLLYYIIRLIPASEYSAWIQIQQWRCLLYLGIVK